MASKEKKLSDLPSEAELNNLKQQDEGYILAAKNALEFLQGRRQAIYNISRKYHLDTEELFQEGYEVLLTCLRDYTPVFQRASGELVKVQFNTFFGNRVESRAMEMRNSNPEYQARQAFTDGMDQDEKSEFRKDPPLLVHHLDQESTMQEYLAGEASIAHSSEQSDLAMRLVRDSFFDQKLTELINQEQDEKKKAALLHVKVGGVYNFQEIAFHFGVTDSRASQVMNELMDAFYVQRMISNSLESVIDDFKKLKFNDKRILRLSGEAIVNAEDERSALIVKLVTKQFPELEKGLQKELNNKQTKLASKNSVKEIKKPTRVRQKQIAHSEIFTDKEEKRWPIVGVEIRNISELKSTGFQFRPAVDDVEFAEFVESFDADSSDYPAVITEDGTIIDGEMRIKAAQAKGKDTYLCITRKINDPLEKQLVRVMVNMRSIKPTKLDLYHAICAMADLGLSQQKMAEWLDTSRTNVLVYAKVRDKASPKMRALFEDGLVQITNASSCADLDFAVQDRVAVFIRKYGEGWSKGSNFNQLHQAAMEGTLDKLESKQEPLPVEITEKAKVADAVVKVDSGLVSSLQKRTEEYERRLKDNEVWSAQREGVITQQTEQLSDAKQEIEKLRRELDAVELRQFGNHTLGDDEQKQIRNFYLLTERLAGASHGFKQSTLQIRKMGLRRAQIREIAHLIDEADKSLNSLRVELLAVEKQ